MPVPGAATRQPVLSQPSRAAVRAQARTQPASSAGASTSSRMSGCPLASTQRWKGERAPHSGWVSCTWRQAPMHQSNGLFSSPYSSPVREVKQSWWRGRCPTAVSASAIASIAATPDALSKAARNQPSWWAPMTIGALPVSPAR